MPQEVIALVGKHNLTVKNENGSAVHKLWDILVHPQWIYNDPSYDADIALVVLRTNVKLTQHVGLVCLTRQSESQVTGKGIIVGWGANEWTDEHLEKMSPTPKELQLPTVTNDECEEENYNFLNVISHRTFCAGFVGEDKSAGAGDSGGGFYQFDKSLRAYKLTGIIATSLTNEVTKARKDTYTVYTDVSKFTNWIENQMKETETIKWKYIDFNCIMR